VIDEYTRECVAIEIRRRIRATDVQEVLGERFLARGCPTHMRSDNGPWNRSTVRSGTTFSMGNSCIPYGRRRY